MGSGAGAVRAGALRGKALEAVPVLISAGLVAAVAACGSGSSSSASSTSSGGGPVTDSAAGLQQQYESVVNSVLPSVVQIFTSDSTGSGVVYDGKGDIVTNAHVVGTAKTVEVVPATGGETVTARVVGTFPAGDLAVVRVESDAGKLKVATFGSSDDVKAGQIVLAMGNPLGLTGSVSQGIVSALGRTVNAAGSSGGQVTTITDAIQTTAAINGGNSGGALVSLSGQVIGIPSAAARDPEAGAAPGIGFAIPSDTATNIANQLISTGKVTNSGRASLGISAQTVATASGQEAGVGIISVTSGDAAAKAGLRAGDIIVEVDQQKTPNVATLNAYLAQLKPGERVQVKYLRQGSNNTSTVTATLGTLTS
jgi:putative serine protease PepD